ncbi:MAG: hypothetical protein COV69_01595 [Parcubacteria group bacterium CG11_big_fil_rev_8_21_14_0_20_39_14]|nr:MAG: hypothetical protein COV69_01595 [Parcubacteria group bacterium CG11_big_fil_rev_8_21_14_0_20_39_14]PIS35289.1 MAG: hypothetical protein COT36_03145 [Parcubacteria group bacterium CG08_land_8_20_14_0_20_38_56]
MEGTKEKCINLRNKGFTLGEIIKKTGLPKTTIYYHIEDISLPIKIQKRLAQEGIARLIEISRKRKGKRIPGRVIPKPKGWMSKLIFLAAHFMFDGEIRYGGCIYQNRNTELINSMKHFMQDKEDINII